MSSSPSQPRLSARKKSETRLPRRIVTTAIEIAESLDHLFTVEEEAFLRSLSIGRFRTRPALSRDIEPPVVRKWELSSGLSFEASPDEQIHALFGRLAQLGAELDALARACCMSQTRRSRLVTCLGRV
jgi:hypothetical protein